MKNIIFKFIIKNWLSYFFLFFTILMLIITIAESVTGLLDSESFANIITNFSYKLPGFLTKILPVNCLLASTFMLSSQKTTNELTAILSSGYSVRRYSATVLFIASIVAAIQFGILAFIEPQVFKHKYSQEISLKTMRKEGTFLARSFLGSGETWYKNENYFVSFTQYVPSSNSLKDITLYYYKNAKLDKKMTSPSASYDFQTKEWILRNAKLFEKLALPSENQKYTEHLKYSVKLKEIPSDFKAFESDIKTFNIFTLREFINKLQNTGIDARAYAILFYEKISLSLVCLLFALFPLTGLSNPNKRNSSTGKNIALTLAFAIFYWLGHSTLLNLAASQRLQPIVASFIMPITILLGLYFYSKKRA